MSHSPNLAGDQPDVHDAVGVIEGQRHDQRRVKHPELFGGPAVLDFAPQYRMPSPPVAL
ncbi:hypothetical protein ACFU9O_25620 [Streptomyces albidoflavus]|uniref:hypothetical protein n=1 Tax=Streptomyces TaxID=1883 RepID=UPI000A737306|nr:MULTISPECIES: hypothetical protein [Streptomyces]MCL6279082.1 hypothetical protein [Streptomyces albidoflavus]MCX4442637.1 hypothetical protein [Streptomyces albidoflavus]MCX4466477.1 hypothetical protein [Streptomyces albidoflavus]MEE1722777.1 hypothetical protein [Streptomyces sp. JV186]WJK70240.1 hypothetical protein QIA47_28640 [Streptomyces albidoflavus]